MPHDTREYIKEAFRTIWNDSNIETKAVYTDNTISDKSSIEWAWKESFGTESFPELLQDVWHASQRIIVCMNKFHPDFSSSKKELQTIFAKLQTENAYETPISFAQSLFNWEIKWKSCSLAGKLTDQEQIIYLGKNQSLTIKYVRITIVKKICQIFSATNKIKS